MCERNENLHLFYLKGSNPRNYRLSLEIGNTGLPVFDVPETQLNHQLGATASNVIEYNVNVQLNEIPQGNSELSVLLGPLSISSSNVCFVLDILDDNDNSIGGGRIRIEEGEQETRPITAL